MTPSPPIRIERRGFRRWWPASREQLKAACIFAESQARSFIWPDPAALCRYMNWCVGEQLSCNVGASIEARHGEYDQPLISFAIGKMEHYVAVRDIDFEEPMLLENRVSGTIAKRVDASTPAMRDEVAKLAAQVGAVTRKVETPATVAPASKPPGPTSPPPKRR